MKWFTIHGAIRDHAKWTQLTMAERGAWITLMTIGQMAEPRWHLGNREHVARLLRREGAEDPDSMVEKLLAVGLLDEVDGGLVLHDGDDWQRKPSDAPERVLERVQRHRNAVKRGVTPTDRQTDKQTGEGKPVTPGNALPTTTSTNGTTHLHEDYHHLTGHLPSSKERDWIADLERAHDRARVAEAMRADPDPRKRGFLERVTQRLISPVTNEVPTGTGQRLADDQWAKDHPGWVAS